MKFRSIFTLMLVAIILFLAESEARRGGSSGRSSYSGGGRSYGGGSKSSYSRTTTRTIRRSNGSSFSGSRIYGSYHPYGGYVLVIGTPYYDSHNNYYYDGTNTYQASKPMSPVAAIIITVIVILICCLCCYLASQNNFSDGDEYETVEVTETVTETVTHHDNGKPVDNTVYAPGTNPPGTILTNQGHLFDFVQYSPYGDENALCENCNAEINWNVGGFHCEIEESDLCANCGNQRLQQDQMMRQQQQTQFNPAMQQQQFNPAMQQQQFNPAMQQQQFNPGMQQQFNPGMQQQQFNPGFQQQQFQAPPM